MGKPNLIYVKKFTVVANTPVERHFLKCQNDTSGNGQSTSLGVSKEHSNNTDINNTEFSNTDPFFSSDFCGKEVDGTADFQRYHQYFYEQLYMEYLKKDFPYDHDTLDLILHLIVEVMCSRRKEAARTVCLLKEKGVDSYEDLVALTDKLTSRFSELSSDIKAAEKRMAEIGVLQTHINNYSKTRKTYEAYRKSGYSKKFFEEHRDELMLHKAAKQAFDQLEGKKVPSRKALHEEFNQLLVEKKQAYAEYRQVKKDMQEYLIAKQTVETILNIDKKKEQEKEQKKPLR